MHKKIIRNLAILNCFLLTLPGLALAAETVPESSDAATVEEVAVTATPLEKYLVTTKVITDKDIEAKGAKNLAEVLVDVSGLNLHRGRKNATTVDIRGSQLTYVKLYIDGILVNPLAKVNGTDSVDLNMFPVDNIAKVEVIKGPAPVAYGTDAIGGIILVTTKSGKDYQGGKVSLSGGSYNTYNGSVSFGGGNDKFNYYFAGGSENTDGFTDNADNKTNYFNTKLNWKLADGASLTFLGGYSKTDKGCLNGIDPIDGHIVSSTKGFWPGLKNWQYRDWERSNLALDYAKKVNDKLDIDFKIYRYTEKQGLWANGADYDPNSGVKLTDGVLAGGSGYSTKRWNYSPWDSALNGVELQGNWKVTASNTLTFGTLYNDIDWKKTASVNLADPNDPNNYYWQGYNNKRYGYYLQDTILPNEKTTITLGVRRDENEVTNVDSISNKKSATNPTVNVVYQLDNRNTLRTSFGQTCSFPLINQLYGTYGNPDLRPEKAKNYEVGFKHKIDESSTWDIAVFQNDFTDKVITNTVTRIPYNVAWAKMKGVELDLNKTVSDRLKVFANYAYLDTATLNQDGNVTQLQYTPRNHINYGLDYQAGKGYTFSLTGHWVLSDRYTNDNYIAANGSKAASDNRTSKQLQPYLSGYHTVDVQVKRQINEKQDWYITVNNIFDKEYYDELFYSAPGRSVTVGTDIKF